MDVYMLMELNAQYHLQGQKELDALNLNYWKQEYSERCRRDNERISAAIKLARAGGALYILTQLHTEQADLSAPLEDELTDSDVIEAVRRAQAPEPDTGYWEYIKRGGVLSLAAWQRCEAERASLYTKPEDEITTDEWRRLHTLDLALVY